MQCRICLEDDDRNTLLSPCNCRGTASYIHQACLDQYIQYYPDRICRVCNSEFRYESPEDIGFCYLMFVCLTTMLFFSNAFIVVKLSLFVALAVLSLYLLRLRLIESTLLTILAVLTIIFFPGGHKDAMYIFLTIFGVTVFVLTLAYQMPVTILLGVVVTTMVAAYSAFFLFLAFHAMDPPAFTVLLCAYFMAWYIWVNMRPLRLQNR